ncbi:MAG: hypothetical protein J6X62_02005 [Bacteroidales bacterium]|nr:hypothetical protein [Bacteroidales bacterium]
MKHHIIKFLAALTLSAMLLTGCGNKAAESKPYEPEGSMGLEELAAIAQDTAHYRAIIFISPYCYGCRQSMSYTLPAVEAMDTALWRVYYLIVEDITDSAHWQEVVGDMADIGARREWIHHWRKPTDGYGYPAALALFHNHHPVTTSDGRIPLELLIDTNNYLAINRCIAKENKDSVWYEPQSLYIDNVTTYTDYSVDYGGYSVISTGRPVPEEHVVVLER